MNFRENMFISLKINRKYHQKINMNNQNFKILTDSFFEVYKEFKTFLLSKDPTILFHSNKININFNGINELELNSFYSKLNIFYNNLNKIKRNTILIHGFIDRQYDLLKQIKYFLSGFNTAKSRSLHDKIFVNIFRMNSHIPLGITRVFEEFIKGITYFSDEEENKKRIPIYHRAASCGNSSIHFRNEYLKCYSTNSHEKVEMKRKHIFKCYLERLIYDKMYQHLTFNRNVEQNEGHQFQLSERAHNFNTCFIGIKLNIDLIFEDLFPVILHINYVQNGVIIKRETYEKITYLDDYGNTEYLDNVYYTCEENNNITEEIRHYNIK